MIMLMSSQRLKHIKKQQKILFCSLTTAFFKSFLRDVRKKRTMHPYFINSYK